MTETSHHPPDLVEAFLHQAQSGLSMAAVDDRGAAVTYGALRSLASRFAGAIQGAASGPSPRVLLALPRSPLAYAAMIGSLIASGTFCHIHVAGPERRNAAFCRAFCPDIIFYEGTPPAFLDALPVTTRRVDVLQLSSHSVDTPAVERSDVAYVVFTSGSTGHPKGVKVGRQGFSYFLHIAQSYFDLRAGERWGQCSNLGHDLGVMDVFMALTQGGT
jgi:D-alanine--poly(phosphoribitol) ligase subunit 1